MLKIENVDVFYGDVQVLWGVSFEVADDEIVALVGANSAGKTTTLRTISGLIKPRLGTIKLDGARIEAMPPYETVKLGVVQVPEARRLFSEMTTLENLELGSLMPEAKKRRAESVERVFEMFPVLKERQKQLAGTLSGGEQQMLAIGRGIMSNPKLLMLDEPSLGLAPILVRETFEIVSRIREAGITILLVEQNVRDTLLIADRGYVLENGRITLEGSGKELLDNEHVKAAYLGL